MNIDQLRQAKHDLDTDLSRLVSDRLVQFERQTGVAPDSVDVHLSSVRLVGCAEPRYAGCTVETRISVSV